ncbi:MAG: polysaccharide pyruvyl transferase family protein [Ruminococcaceae bacterium]|nr:polysaccharide pyruvyl transferase family protein [Oscillospiraceae bacterium]
MKRAGILTFHRADNYGAVLQCYAMQKYLEKRGLEPLIIDYTNERILNMYNPYISLFKTYSEYKESRIRFPFFRAAKTYCNNIFFLRKYKKHQAFEKFRNSYLNFSPKYTDPNDFVKKGSCCDVIFVGSDQVWNKRMYGGKYDEMYFLNKADPHILKASYAASAGDTIPNEDEDCIRIFLKDFDYISTREEKLAEQLTGITGKECHSVLDPVFLLSSKEWKELLLSQNPYKKEKYILSYNISADTTITEYISLVDSIAEKMNLKVYEISKQKKSSKDGKLFSSIGPKEFIQLIDGAEFVFTSSFHATALSIILKKQFNVFIPKYATRIENILEIAGLKHKMIYPGGTPEYSSVDYNQVSEKISKQIQKSKEFINTVIK